MIEDFRIQRELFEDTHHETLHFMLKLDGKEYKGHFKDGEVNWFQMQPNPDDHEIEMEDLEAEVKRLLQ